MIPTLHDGDVIIMDNMRSHHVKEVAEVIGQSDKHLFLLYLPPYSPDFNPIEMMWSKIRTILRMLKARVPEMLSKAVEIAFSKSCLLTVLGGSLLCWIGNIFMDCYKLLFYSYCTSLNSRCYFSYSVLHPKVLRL